MPKGREASDFLKLCQTTSSHEPFSHLQWQRPEAQGIEKEAAMVTWWTSKLQPCTYKIARQFISNSHGGALSAVNISKCSLFPGNCAILVIASADIVVRRRPRDNCQEAIFFRRYLPIKHGSGSFHSHEFPFTCQDSSVVAKTLVETPLEMCMLQ